VVKNGNENDETQNTVWLGNPLWPADPARNPKPGAVVAGHPGFVARVGVGNGRKAETNQARIDRWNFSGRL
jgi:hypothetical protein